jgi:hypothetical protein
MPRTVFSIREQVERSGHFCSITFDVEEFTTDESSLKVEYFGEARWEAICRNGTNLFFEYYLRCKIGRLEVKIIEVDWYPVDTTGITVLYATIKGLSENLKIDIKDLYFDKTRQAYSIPDPRNLLKAAKLKDEN